MKIKDIMTRDVIFCAPYDPITEAARLMYLNGLTGLPVVDELDQVVGIVTERDLVKMEEPVHVPKMLAILGSAVYLDNPVNGDEVEKQLVKLTATKVNEIMTEEVISIRPEASLEELAEIFIHKKVNPVPVLDAESKLVGIVSMADIVKLLSASKDIATHRFTALAKRNG